MGFICKELKQEFGTKKEMFKALKEQKEHIVALKKAAIKFTDPIGYAIRESISTKEDNGVKTVGIGDYVFPVINTTNFLDSHSDVHIDGIWDVSIKDQKGKIYYIINHDLELGKVIAFPGNVEAYVKTLEWSELGQPYSGKTQALIFKTKLTESANKDALNAIVNREPLENSVRMRYISMTLCIDDSSDEFKQEYENFYKYLAIIANKDKALEQGYFWAITEAAIHKEGSAVLFGSNEATPILYTDPSDDSQENKIDPPLSSQKVEAKESVKASLKFNLI
ncbi:hypothetical protein OHD16_06675 [Sphingobacterium sp. ML3W]|uniref:hypothetical protein n=1 Tax=Sphingobacterium sp. ML3W TaxID=1538644 RepID=UPI00249C8CE8|nr:hypothetical protein [Sphingobacterium sp. ML3W]WFA79653.1 hypothetical protein OGI71_26915 [Sphingobacterium sp. ML3W]